MDVINVLILSPIGDERLRQIAAVSPRIRVTDAAHLVPKPPFISGRKENAAYKQLDPLLAEAEVILGFVPPHVVARSPHLKWIQSTSAGVDNALTEDVVNSRVTVTNVSGIHTVQISELVFAMMLMFAKRLVQCLQNQKNQKWEPYSPGLLNGKTLGIVGLGNIGRGIARLGQAYGMRVIATRRTIQKVSRTRCVDTVYPREQLDQLLAESDYVVLALPYTKETDKMIGEKELRCLKSSAFLVNIGRGHTVDEEALIRALKEKWIAGAGLDTFANEPLPPESPLWELTNVILTPHVAGRIDDYMTKATAVFCENLKRYVNGRRLINVVDKKHGY
jgi:phosphoglycerate dehydrogenase-like enzyme